LRPIILLVVFLSASSSAKVLSQQDSLILIDNLVIYYDSDQYELSSTHDSLLMSFFEYQNTSELEFYIDSYTDSDGNNDYNINLSDRRKNAIVSWLKDHQIDDSRIRRKGHGEQFALSKEESTKIQDRRSEIKVFQRTPFKLFQGTIGTDDPETVTGLEINVFDSGIRRTITIDSGARFSVAVPLKREVELIFEAKNHFPEVRTLRLSARAKVDDVKVPMVDMKEGNKVALHVQFVGDKSIVLDRFKSSLTTLASALRKSDEICIELAGHIHQPGAVIDDPNIRSYGLSIARSIEIHNYLVDEGIDADRLLARGYSNRFMINPNPSNEAGASANRRVEAIVMSCDSTRLISNDDVENLESYKLVITNQIVR
jgi:outer membrane protein OmpA-like peptidoglycan-associated protein